MHTVRNRTAVHNRAKPLVRANQGGNAPPGLPKVAPPVFMFGGTASPVEPHVLPVFPADVTIARPLGPPIISISYPEEPAAGEATAEVPAKAAPKPARKRKAAAKPGAKTRKKKRKSAARPRSRAKGRAKAAKTSQARTQSANPAEREQAAATAPDLSMAERQPAVEFTVPELPQEAATDLPFPQEAGRLTAAVPAQADPEVPLPRSVALAPYRKGGLFDLIGYWLRDASRRAASRLLSGKTEKQPARRKRGWLSGRRSSPSRENLAVLCAENDRLRSQIEALLALQVRQAE